jgi:hypothetical protein
MLYMMAKNVPGLYYFFIGEERGGIGSRALADVYDEVDYLKNIKRCVSFDRRKTISVITSQAGGRCCSDEFGNALCEQYNSNGLNLKIDPTGVFTDSASFIDDIPECTNVSVGYLNEHTGKEIQNMDYLIDLCKASVNVDWSSLPTVRTVQDRAAIKQMISNVKSSNKEFVDALKGINLDKTISTDHGNVYVNFDLENEGIDNILESLKELRKVMRLHKRPTSCLFDETYLQIILGKDTPSKITTLNLDDDKYESNKLKKYNQFCASSNSTVPAIRMVEMQGADIQRSPIVSTLLDIYAAKPFTHSFPNTTSYNPLIETETSKNSNYTNSNYDAALIPISHYQVYSKYLLE